MKKVKQLMFFVVAFFFLITYVSADTVKYARIDYNNMNIRTGPGTNHSVIKTLAINSSYKLAEQKLVPSESTCPGGWYKIFYSGDKTGYICGSYVTIIDVEIQNYETHNDCEEDLKSKGFPQSYVASLCTLKEKFPNWNFEADYTGLDYPTTIQRESVVGKSLISSSEPGYLSLDVGSYDYLTDKFTVKEGKTWYAANSDVVAYYMDPRNFFDERYIFMFEKLSYDASYQTKEAVEAVLKGRDIAQESETILNASKDNNINAIYLASKIRQETGGNYTNYSIKGVSTTYNGVTYNHVYNPYNIGASTGAEDGIRWAVAGTSYLRPWTTLQIAIRGGAQVISSTYIGKGQDTVYYQKFNTSSYSAYSPYSHEYMTNIRGAAGEASIAYNGYNSMDLLNNTAFTFVIPIYNNLDSKYEMPKTGNPNNHLKELKINDVLVDGFEHDNFEYSYHVSALTNSINISATTINSKAKISNVGQIQLPNETNVIEIIVTAENGKVQKYTITVTKSKATGVSVDEVINSLTLPKSDNSFILSVGFKLETINAEIQNINGGVLAYRGNDTSGLLKTGDILNITNGEDNKEITVIIKGDATGDGKIDIKDLLRVQKGILKMTDLSGPYLKASDVNQDNDLTILDLLRVQKHILGYLTIS